MLHNREIEPETLLNEFTLYEVDDWETILVEENAAADHLVTLGDGSWGLWRWVCLRGAGFPVHDVLELAAPHAAAAATQLLDAEANHARCQAELLETLAVANRDCRQALLDPALNEESQETLRQTIRTLRRAEKQVFKGQLPDAAELPESIRALVQATRATLTHLNTCLERFEPALRADNERVAAAIHAIATNPRFREAITWQNRHALHTGVDALLRGTPSAKADKKTRRRQELIANYVQRYSVKNDSIGFFGPVGWAKANPEQATTSVELGADLVKTRTVYFEDWGITKLAALLSQDERLRIWCIPYRMPFSYLQGTTLYLQAGQTIALSVKQATVLQACDGQTPARQMAQQLVRHPLSGIREVNEVYDILRGLADARRIVWQVEIPIEGAYPEIHLRQWAHTIEDESLRERVLRPLAELEEAREKVSAAAGNPHQLDQALSHLDDTFTQLTGANPTRRAGKTYAARTLVYEDCRRDIQVNLGADLLSALEAPLSLLLTSARWFTYQAARYYRQALRQLFADLHTHYPISDRSRPTVGMSDFWLWCHSLLFGDNTQPVDDLVADFQQRWADILRDEAGNYCAHYDSHDLTSLVQNAFAAPGPGWPSARYHSPDVMIAAASLEALQQGDYQFILGEVHVGVNTLTASCFLNQHPAPEELFKAVQSDLTEPCFIPLSSQEWQGKVARTQMVIMSPNDIRLIVSPNTSTLPGAHSLSIGELLVEDTGSTLLVRTRDGQQSYDIIDVLAQFLVQAGLSSFKITPSAKHTPRITFDRLVVNRETWRFGPEELPFAEEEEENSRFLATRRWQREQGLPRFVFVKAPVEQKPFYVDFDSPLYIQLLAKVIRQTRLQHTPTTAITFTEMLPSHEQTWLPDANGCRYTSELRLVAVDRLPTS
jgi:hypothetical protein